MEDAEQVYSNCPNTCCTGAFIQEAMAGVIMSADIRELIFTSEQVIRKLRHLCFRLWQKKLEIPVLHVQLVKNVFFPRLLADDLPYIAA